MNRIKVSIYTLKKIQGVRATCLSGILPQGSCCDCKILFQREFIKDKKTRMLHVQYMKIHSVWHEAHFHLSSLRYFYNLIGAHL